MPPRGRRLMLYCVTPSLKMFLLALVLMSAARRGGMDSTKWFPWVGIIIEHKVC